MANNLDAFTTGRILYARELLDQLRAVLFLAQTVSRRYSVVGNMRGGIVRVPNIVVPNVQKRAKNSGPVTFGDTSVTSVDVTLTEHAIVPMQIDSIDQVVSDIDFRTNMAIRAAYKIAEAVEADLASLYSDVGQFVGDADDQAWGTTAPALAAIGLLDDAKAPVAPRFGALSVGGKQSALGNAAFTQFNTAGPASTIVTGDLGMRFGVLWGMAQGLPTHRTADGTTDWGTPLVNNAGGYAIGATSILVDGLAASGALKKGDAFILGNHYYSLAADVTAVTGGATLTLAQPLATAVVNDQPITVGEGVRKGVQNLVYLPEAFAFATAPVDDVRPGTESSIVVDDQTGLAIRVTYSYDHPSFAHLFTTELLYGFKTIRPELAVRLISKA